MQAVPVEFWNAAERLGTPLAILTVLAVFMGKVFWPYLVEQNNKMHKVLTEQIEAANRRATLQSSDFLGALEKQSDMYKHALDRQMEAQRGVNEKVVERLDRIDNNTRIPR